MPRLTRTTPKYRRHKASGQAVVTIEGRDHYLGPWRTKASTIEYDRLIGEWLARGRPDTAQGTSEEITVSELMAAYWTFAKGHYRKDGKPTSQIGLLRLAFRPLLRLYGPSLANRFGPLSLQGRPADVHRQRHFPRRRQFAHRPHPPDVSLGRRE